MISYGYRIPNLVLDGESAEYDVLNERAIRAGAGIMFAIGFATMIYTMLTGDFSFLFVVLPIFWLDFAIRVFFTPRWSPISFVAGLLVIAQRPERVGAIQKRFARSIGFVLATTMMILVFGFEVRGIILPIICGTCLFFMWMESALGICVGCSIYSFLRTKNILPDPGYRPACPGGACSIKKSH